jgi:shikimate dehydrogenase
VTAQLAVLGSPVVHSRSPQLHAAAYRVLGLDWRYSRVEVDETTLPAFLAALDGEWRGLSLTMPLKRAVLPLVPGHDPLVDRLGLANTAVLGPDPALFNTDVGGIQAVLGPLGAPYRGVVLGAGATAASALEALRLLGATERVVAARDTLTAERRFRGLATAVVPLAAAPLDGADVVVVTLPGGVDVDVQVPARVPGAALLDVAYDPWPSRIGAEWAAAGGVLLHGLDMLIEQAVLQVRAFTSGDPATPLPDEQAVRTAMRSAVGRGMEDF